MRRSGSMLLVVLLFSALGASAQTGGGRYMIKFRDFKGAASAVRAAGGIPIYEFANLGVVAAHLPSQALQGLQNHPNVEYVEDDVRRQPFAQTTPYGIPMVQADQLTFADGNSATCKVCIIDSGYAASHEDLQEANVTASVDSGSGDPLSDTCGHGTHVAGTVAALDNAAGVIGVVPTGGISLHIVKVFGGTDCAWTYSSDLINALNKCKSAGAKIVSMSLGGSFSSRTEQSAFNAAWADGVLSIAAAGNGGNNRKSYPASYSSVVSVAAVDASKTVASFSQFNSEVDIAAPGVGVLSTVPWKGASLTVGTARYLASGITGSKESEGVSGALANGGLCTSAGSWSGKVVLCERGDISFRDKVNNVVGGGGVAAVIYNNASGGFAGTCDDGTGTTCNAIPAISISQEDGQSLASSTATATVVNSSGPGSGYEAWDGTSMATPHVSGVAALVWSNFPGKSNADIRNALEATARDLGAAGRDDYYGHGLVQAKAAYDLLAGGSTCKPTTEVCGDGIDNDCDGQIDEGCGSTCTDADGDGFTTCDGDCNDNNNKIYPGANDTRGKPGRDGIDNDCDGTPDA